MGNKLCKDPYNTSPTINPVERVLGSCGNMMCPNGFGKKNGCNNNCNNTHAYETRPNTTLTTSKPIYTISSWHNATLKTTNGTKVIETPPVAPPRKKRPSALQSRSSKTLPVPKNGFKDVFGNETRRHSVDKAKTPLSGFEVDAKNDAFEDFSKVPTTREVESPISKVPSVGNKKTDKFFGENLSDALSAEPYLKEPEESKDQIDSFIEENVTPQSKSMKELGKEREKKEENKLDESIIAYIDDTVGKSESLDTKAKFLMAMLEDYSDMKRYADAKPVTEEIIVPKRRKSRHICDDDDHIHHHLHKNEKSADSANKLITVEASIEAAPKKPVRDFSKYQATTDWSDSDDYTVAKRPMRAKSRSISRKDLPSPPAKPEPSEAQFQFNLSDARTSTPMQKSPRILKRNTSVPANIEPYISPPRPTLPKSNSSSSFLDLKKCQAFDNFSPEDHFDGREDNLIGPTSKLAVRKISTTRRSTENFPIPSPTVEESCPKFTIGNREVITTLPVPETPRIKKISFGNGTDLGSIQEGKVVVHPTEPSEATKSEISTVKLEPVEKPKEKLTEPVNDLGTFIASSRVLDEEGITHVIDQIYDANKDILKDFQTFLEKQINLEITVPHSTYLNERNLLNLCENTENLENEKLELVESEKSNNPSDIDDCFDAEFEKIEKPALAGLTKALNAEKRHNSLENIDNWFTNKHEDQEEAKIKESEEGDALGDIPLPHFKGGPRTGRRESIEDVDNWFSSLQYQPSTEEIYGARKGRSGSDGLLVYDTTRQYPFSAVSRNRNDSMSSDFFDDVHHDEKRKKKAKETVRDERAAVEHSNVNDEDLLKDHSTLLKFLAK